MTSRTSFFLCIALLTSNCYFVHSAAAQHLDDPQIGISPFQSYLQTDVYHVNEDSGNVYGHIRLASYQQRGGLPPLDFYLTFNTANFLEQEACEPLWDECVIFIDYPPAGGAFLGNGAGVQLTTSYSGATVHVDTDYNPGMTFCDTDMFGTPGFCLYNVWAQEEVQWSLSDWTGAGHPMLWDQSSANNNYNRLFAQDGSGWSLLFPASATTSSYDPNNLSPANSWTAFSPSGITYKQIFEGGPMAQITISDATGNNILTRSATNDTWTDSVGRTMPDIEAANINGSFGPVGISSDVSACPNLGQSNPAPQFSVPLNLPGQSGKTITYLICYTQVAYHTGFFSYTGGNIATDRPWPTYDPESCNTLDPYASCQPTTYSLNTEYGFYAIQSVVLPDSSGNLSSSNPYWGFIYDSEQILTDSNGNSYGSESYGSVVRIQYPTGASVSMQYVTPGAPSGSNRAISSITKNDGLGNLSQTTFQYSTSTNGVLSTNTTQITDAEGNVTAHSSTVRTQAQGTGYIIGYISQTDEAHYQGSQTGTPLSETTTKFTQTNVGPPSAINSTDVQVYVSYPSTELNYLNGALLSTKQYGYPPLFTAERIACKVGGGCYTGYQPSGTTLLSNVQSSVKTNDSNGNPMNTTVDIPQYVLCPIYRNANILVAPGLTSVSDGLGNILAQTQYGYDEATAGSLTCNTSTPLGMQTSVNRWWNVAANSYVTDSTQYDSYGMPTLKKDSNGGIVKINSMQCLDLFPLSITSAYNTPNAETTSTTVDCNTGQVTSAIDANGVESDYTYNDALNRLTQVKRAVGTSNETWVKISYPYLTETDVAADKTTKGDGLVANKTIYDGFSRVIRQINPNGSTVSTKYDLNGRIASVSNPYLGSANTTDGLTQYAYDALGRMLLQCNPDNGTSASTCVPGSSYRQWSYSANTVVMKDELMHSWTRTYDSLMRMTEVTEPSGYNTYYAYDALGNLTCAAQDGGSGGTFSSCAAAASSWRPRHFAYDNLSRLLTASNPETGTVCYGVWSGGSCVNGYDANGNLLAKTDARGVVTYFSYDNLNRLHTKSYVNAPTGSMNTCYQYDNGAGGANGIGHLWFEWTQPASCPTTTLSAPPTSYQTLRVYGAYDATGRVVGEQQCVAGYCTSAAVPAAPSTPNCASLAGGNGLLYCYDLAGNLLAYSNGIATAAAGSYPQMALSYAQTFDTAGHLVSVNSSWSDATHPSPLFSQPSYNPANALSQWLLGAHLNVGRTYDDRLRVTGQTSTHQ